MRSTLKYDVIIAGAGPAGCAAALALKDAGLKTALIDKASFPRDKICGDAIPGRAIKTLHAIDPAYEQAFSKHAFKYATKSTTLFFKSRKVTFNWVREAYTCTRMEFDNFLFSLVKNNTDTDIYLNTNIKTATKNADGYEVITGDSTLHCKILIGADGAHSVLAKQLAGRTMNREHFVGSVRAYYSNVAGLSPDTTEIYFDKRFLPSYLWVFPLPGNRANVGFGMLSSEIAKRKANIRETFYEFIDQNPVLKEKFSGAKRESPLEGFGLPLGSEIGTISGDHFLLTGDAASLIDPVSGDGIGNAMLSGKLAAEQAVSCFKERNFTGTFISGYDKALHAAIGNELRTHYKAQRFLSKMPLLLDSVFLLTRSAVLKRIIQKAL
jgi:geranylgeranyl reductase family protein